MTFEEVLENYQAQQKKACASYDEFRKTGKFNGFSVDYAGLDRDLIQAAKDEFWFTEAQAQFIHSEAYDRYHSSYSDMPFGMRRLCEFALGFKNLT